MKIKNYLEKYKARVAHSGYSATTKAITLRRLRILNALPDAEISSLQASDVADLLVKSTQAASSRRAYFTLLASIFHWIELEAACSSETQDASKARAIAEELEALLKTTKSVRKVNRVLTGAEIQQIIERAPPGVASLIWIFSRTGLRRKEILPSNSVYDPTRAVLRVTNGKGSHEREIPVGPDFAAHYREMLTWMESQQHWICSKCHRAPLIPVAGHPLFPCKGCGGTEWLVSPANEDSVYRAIKHAARDAGFGWVKTHTLRHTFATMAMQGANSNVFVLQKVLGHQDIKTTSIYITVSPEEKQRLTNGVDALFIS